MNDLKSLLKYDVQLLHSCEEYEADELLTSLAKTSVNMDAQAGTPTYA